MAPTEEQKTQQQGGAQRKEKKKKRAVTELSFLLPNLEMLCLLQLFKQDPHLTGSKKDTQTVSLWKRNQEKIWKKKVKGNKQKKKKKIQGLKPWTS